MNRTHLLFFSIAMICTVLGFQNCGYFGTEGDFSSSYCANAYSQPLFEKGHYQFFLDNSCNDCHGLGGTGSGDFAQNDVADAFAEFNIRGPAKIRSKLTAGHQGYNINEIDQSLKEAEAIYEQAITTSTCSTSGGGLGRTEPLTLNFFEEELMFGKKRVLLASDPDNFEKIKTLTFPLDDDIFKPRIEGGEISIDVEVFFDPDFFFPTHYQLRNPRITNPDQPIRIKGLKILLNGDDFLVTTFSGLDVELEASSEPQLIDPGSADAVFLKEEAEDIYDNSDEWSLYFDSIELL